MTQNYPLVFLITIVADCIFCLKVIEILTTIQLKGKTKTVEAVEPVEVLSMMGSVTDEKGGASVRFEVPLDDLSTVDIRWVRRMVLRTLEMLYYENQWEHLSDIALRFNAVSEYVLY